MAFLPMLSQWSMQVINTTLFGISNRHIVVTYQHLALSPPPSTPHQHRTPDHHTVASAFNTFHKFNTVALNGVYNPSPLSSNVSPP